MTILLCVIAGWMLGWFFTRRRPGVYQSPELHQGEWGGPRLMGQRGQTRVRWLRQDRFHCRAKRHQAVECNVGPGVAHMDVCACGATRSGVFGEWLS